MSTEQYRNMLSDCYMMIRMWGSNRDVKPWVVIFGCVLLALNFIFLVFWIWTGHSHAVGPYGRSVDTYDAISLQITILGVVITAVAIGLAVAAVFGYQGLRDHMLMRTDQLISERLQNHPLLKGGNAPEGLSPKGPDLPINDAGVAPATEG